MIAIFTTEEIEDHCNQNICGVLTDALKETYKELQDVTYEFTLHMKQKDKWFDPTSHIRLPNEAVKVHPKRRIEIERCMELGHCSPAPKEKVDASGNKEVFYLSIRLYRNGIE